MLRRYRLAVFNIALVLFLFVFTGWTVMQRPSLLSWLEGVTGSPAQSLKGIEPPLPPDLDRYVRDREAAKILGKAFFWDMQAGGDGIQSCGTCHFSAGVDTRIKNALSPTGATGTDMSFSFGGPNYTLKASDFPFDRTKDEVVSSAGVAHAKFLGILDDADFDENEPADDLVFHVNGTRTRRIEPRNTPTMINAVFNFRTLWDGRGNNIFNGVSHLGNRDEDACIWMKDGSDYQCESVEIENGALPSQAVIPPLSDFEMSGAGRVFPMVGRKLLNRRPLAKQEVHPQDGLHGPLRHPDGGLSTTYKALIEDAFADDLWSDTEIQDGYTQTELNFSLFWGLAIMMYESTLISDDSPYDRFVEGDPYALTDRQKLGLGIFAGKGKCMECHSGPLFSNAFLQGDKAEDGALIERMKMGDGGTALYDLGFYNIGVRPEPEDLGVGNVDPFNNPLSFTRQYIEALNGGETIDPFHIDPCQFDEIFNENSCSQHPDGSTARAAVDGAVKTPQLRNVELTAPYFRNGSQATLMQVVEFYNRGGAFRTENRDNLDPNIAPLGLTQEEKEALVDFLISLTDERVRNQEAPFDHPSIMVPHGHVGDHTYIMPGADGSGQDEFIAVEAVGKHGDDAMITFNERLGLDHFDGFTRSELADLSLGMEVDDPAPTDGDEIEISIDLYNDGPDTADDVVVYIDIPSDLEYVDHAGGAYYSGTWDVGSIDPGDWATLELTLEVTDDGAYQVFADVEASSIGDPDSTPGNRDASEDDYARVHVTATESSPSADAGVESDGSLATKLARRLFVRREDALARRSLMAAPQPVALTASSDAAVAPSFAKSGGERTNLASLIPADGPAGSSAYVSTPVDLLGITNATSVFGADYLRTEGRRLGAFFGATSPDGVLYDHAKTTCDRLGGGRLENVDLLTIEGYPFVVSELIHADGAVDFAVSFVAYRVGDEIVIDSRFAADEYRAPAGTGEVINIQLWSVAPAYTALLVSDVLERIHAIAPVSFLNRPEAPPALPAVFVRSGEYAHGKLALDLIVRGEADHIELSGSVARTESAAEYGDREAIRSTHDVPTPDADGRVRIEIETGSIFDASFTVSSDHRRGVDQLYYADGPWSYAEGPASSVESFVTAADARTVHSGGTYAVERSVHLSGQVSDWVSAFRYLRPGGEPVDLSAYRYLEFSATGPATVRLVLEKASITTFDQFGYDLSLDGGAQRYRVAFDDLARYSGTAGFTPEDVTMLAFYVTDDDGRAGGAYDLRIEDVSFGGASSVAVDEGAPVPATFSLAQNYPNPFNPSTTIRFDLPEAADVQLIVYDMLGREVDEPAQGRFAAGRHHVEFDASDIASGVYVYRLTTGERVAVRQMILMK